MEERKGRKLLRSCINQLNKITKTDSGSNHALYPVITIFLGQQTAGQFSTVKDVLDTNWQNGEYLKYLQIVKKEKKNYCRDLVTGVSSDIPSAFMEHALVEMLGTDEYIFRDKSRVRLEFILAGEEDGAEEYFDLMLQPGLSSRYNLVKTIFIMLDESEKDKRQRICKFLGYVTEKRKSAKSEFGAVYLLSNYLKDGNVLLDYRMSLNYRLVADLILLGGNQGADKHSNVESSIEGYNVIKTAAYALVEKPVRSIAIVSLIKIMNCLMEENLRTYQSLIGDAIQSADKLQEKLDIRRGKIQCLETIFQENIIKAFPSPFELSYLAYINKREFREVHKEKQISFARLNQATGGNWSLFYEENYTKELDRLLSDGDFMTQCMDKIENGWRSVLTYEDILYGLEDNRVLEALREFTVSGSFAGGRSIEESIHLEAVEEMRKRFYSHMLKRLTELLRSFHQEAQQFNQIYSELNAELQKEVLDEGDQNIKSHYEHLAELFLHQEKSEISRQIFRIENTGEKLYQKLAQLFGSLITSDPIFFFFFEQEMQARLNTMSGEDRVLMVKNVLEEKIENKIRLHGSNTSYESNLRGIFYLMNRDAEYARELDSDSRSFTIFHLKRTDCIEKIAIYDLDSPNAKDDCNLTEMAGEA